MAQSFSLVKYDDELFKGIQELFINKIVPDNFILVIHKYNSNVLTLGDIQKLRKATSVNADKDVNFELLSKMKSYNGWFEVILQVCNDPDVKQSYLVEEFTAIRSQLDEKFGKERTKIKEIDTELANVTLKSEIKKGKAAMGRQSSTGALKSESEAVGIVSETKQWRGKNKKEILSTEDQKGFIPQTSWEGLTWNDGKPFCNICLFPLKPENYADHDKGKHHRMKLKELTEDRSKTDINKAAISQATYVDAKSTPSSFKSNPGSHKPAAFSGSKCDSQVMSKSLKPVSGSNEGNLKELSTEDQKGSVYQSTEEGFKRKNEKIYCNICSCPLRSEKAAEDHYKGKQHQKKLEETTTASQGISTPEISMAAMSQAMYVDVTPSPLCHNPNPVSNKAAAFSGPKCGPKVMPKSLKPLSCGNEGITQELLTEDQTLIASSWGGLKMKDGNQYCDICDKTLNSPAVVEAHCNSKSHEKKLQMFHSSQGACGTGLTSAGDFQASSSSISAMPTNSRLPRGSEPAVNPLPIGLPGSKGNIASFKKKKSASFDIPEAASQGLGSSAMKEQIQVPVTPKDSATQQAQGRKQKKKLEVSMDQDNSNKAAPELGPNGEIIVLNEDGVGKCFLCNALIKTKESAELHLEGKRHKNQCKIYNLL